MSDCIVGGGAVLLVIVIVFNKYIKAVGTVCGCDLKVSAACVMQRRLRVCERGLPVKQPCSLV